MDEDGDDIGFTRKRDRSRSPRRDGEKDDGKMVEFSNSRLNNSLRDDKDSVKKPPESETTRKDPIQNAPVTSNIPHRDQTALTSLDNQIKKDMPQSVRTRLKILLAVLYINVLFLLVYFPITV